MKTERRKPNFHRTIVHVARVRCPHCESAELKTRRTVQNLDDGSTSRDMLCRTCGETFVLVVAD